MVYNTAISGVHKKAMDFFLNEMRQSNKFPFIDFDAVVKQINEAEISLDTSKNYCIIKFLNKACVSTLCNGEIELQIINKADNQVPTVFIMHFRNNSVYEFEYFNADSSKIDENEIFNGDVLIEFL